MCKKKVKSFNLSDDALIVIEEYKKDNRLGSNSLALEKILLDEYNKKDKINEACIRRIIEDALKQKDLAIDKVENDNDDTIVDEVMESSIANMKELFKNMN